MTNPFAVLRTRAALGLQPATVPALFFVPLGIVLGPQGLGILSVDVLGHLDAVVSIALATLGVFVGIAFGRHVRGAVRFFAAASVEASVTLLVVAICGFVLLQQWNMPLDVGPAAVALALGICAAVSGAGPHTEDPEAGAAARIADLDDILPILLGGGVLVLMRQADVGHAAVMTLATVAVGLAIASVGWLLFDIAGAVERGGLVLGALALLAGSAAYLGLSPLLAGLSAGLFWKLAPGRADAIMDDLRRAEHPLVVLLLLTTGAALTPSLMALWLFAPYVTFRLFGKLAGGWAAAQIAGNLTHSALGAQLAHPGVLGIAFALNVQQVAPSGTTGAMLSAVAMGALVSEAIAIFVTPPPPRPSQLRAPEAEPR
jgi:hypothetical protein